MFFICITSSCLSAFCLRPIQCIVEQRATVAKWFKAILFIGAVFLGDCSTSLNFSLPLHKCYYKSLYAWLESILFLRCPCSSVVVVFSFVGYCCLRCSRMLLTAQSYFALLDFRWLQTCISISKNSDSAISQQLQCLQRVIVYFYKSVQSSNALASHIDSELRLNTAPNVFEICCVLR